MSYNQAMKWQKTHRKGTHQPIIMHTNSGFWPSYAFLMEDYIPYTEQCKINEIIPITCQEYYNAIINGIQTCNRKILIDHLQ